jgi:hypothetical protein
MQQNQKVIIGITAVLILVLAVFATVSVLHSDNTQVKTAAPQGLAGMQKGDAPWLPELAHLKERLAAIGLPALSQEGTALHTHQHLDIFIHGKSVAIPAGIGINDMAQFIAPIHVHDDTGIIHVESPTVQTFTLGQFFDIWGVQFDQNFIGGYVSAASSTLKVYVNGKKVERDPRAIELTAHEEIAVVFGSLEEQPVIPTSYSFPAGL